MLQHLLIKDLAVVAFVDILFGEGMTVITGETGAGKSILLDALALALGQRSDSDLIRPGAKQAEIAATFDISSLPGAVLWLADLELTHDSPEQCIIRRILFANGRSRAFINGKPVTTQQLRLLGDYLVQIHGQHQHQLLLKSHEQLRLLDAFGQHDVNLSQVKTAFKAWEQLKNRQAQLLESSRGATSHNDLLQYQIAELDALNLGEQELAQLYHEHDKQAHAQSDIQSCELALSILENQEQGNALEFIHKAQQALRVAADHSKELANANICLENARIQLEEATLEINHFVGNLEVNPQRLEKLEKRLERIHEIARKHRVDALKLYDHHQYLKKEIAKFSSLQITLESLEKDIQLAFLQYQQCAKALTKQRMISSQQLAAQVTQAIHSLAMPGALFTVQLISHDDNALHLTGNETVLFGISANPGHPPQPLHKVASGGELSRISLALELVTHSYLATPCLIFDEVDVGISGKTGAIVGKALHDLGRSAQVLTVTHLPQVAAFGDNHLQVTKKRCENTTQTEIQTLSAAERVNEIARMLGGIDVTTQARAHAKQLLKLKEETLEA